LVDLFVDATSAQKVTGLENVPKDRGFLIVANHQNNYDPLIIAVALYPFSNAISNQKITRSILSVHLVSKMNFCHPFISALLTLGMDSIGYLPAV